MTSPLKSIIEAGTKIWIDTDAAGHGWNVGKGEGQEAKGEVWSVELTRHSALGTRQWIDLLTVVSHELGHVLGLDATGTNEAGPGIDAGVATTLNTVAGTSTNGVAGAAIRMVFERFRERTCPARTVGELENLARRFIEVDQPTIHVDDENAVAHCLDHSTVFDAVRRKEPHAGQPIDESETDRGRCEGHESAQDRGR